MRITTIIVTLIATSIPVSFGCADAGKSEPPHILRERGMNLLHDLMEDMPGALETGKPTVKDLEGYAQGAWFLYVYDEETTQRERVINFRAHLRRLVEAAGNTRDADIPDRLLTLAVEFLDVADPMWKKAVELGAASPPVILSHALVNNRLHGRRPLPNEPVKGPYTILAEIDVEDVLIPDMRRALQGLVGLLERRDVKYETACVYVHLIGRHVSSEADLGRIRDRLTMLVELRQPFHAKLEERRLAWRLSFQLMISLLEQDYRALWLLEGSELYDRLVRFPFERLQPNKISITSESLKALQAEVGPLGDHIDELLADAVFDPQTYQRISVWIGTNTELVDLAVQFIEKGAAGTFRYHWQHHRDEILDFEL